MKENFFDFSFKTTVMIKPTSVKKLDIPINPNLFKLLGFLDSLNNVHPENPPAKNELMTKIIAVVKYGCRLIKDGM